MKKRKYVLINTEDNKLRWYLILREYDLELILHTAELLQDSMIRQVFEERKGLDVDLIVKFTNQSIENKTKLLEEGKILLVNENGGYMFLEGKYKIIEEVEDTHFPNRKSYLTGWLSPKGKFHPCEYGEHMFFAQELVEKNVEDMDSYIRMGHSYLDNISYIDIAEKNMTDEQKNFFEKNKDKLSEEQIKILNIFQKK